VYPIDEDMIVVPDRKIGDDWPRCYGLDVGWNVTCAEFLAQDPLSKVWYVYSEHYMGKEEPVIHAAAIKARGAFIPGVIDPASRGRSQHDGRQLIQQYRELGLDVEPADNSVEAGVFLVWQLFSGGMLKIFESVSNLRAELRFYRRNENGKIIKERDHGADSLRYACMSGRERARVAPVKKDLFSAKFKYGNTQGSWMN
jgi:hypothetical protein